ncbi:Phosphatidate phosphatase LPIN2 [Armadillidium nasatum]|uniref:phosphatidate phosphatase n=1 Tax=Armadillidium nasatum TaxID=96803 RepID=A0A5N5TAX7_9CRUS|nr:Phosphatidate phosphatase LPIN2 [Armadillidium nasatum]
MNYIGKFISNFKEAYNEINGATLTGAIDAVVVRQEDGTLVSSPFHVRFGKIGVLRSREKVVDIEINGEPVDIHMKLGETGEAFFVEEVEDGDDISSFLGTSPLPNYFQYNPSEDDIRSLDSGVDAEEYPCKSEDIKETKDSTDSNKISCDNSQPKISNASKEKFDDCDGNNVSYFVNIESKSDSCDNGGGGGVNSLDKTPFLTGLSPSVNVPKQKCWRDELVRSKSLTGDSPFQKASNVLVDGHGSKTDVEETIKVTKTTRKRKKRRTSRKEYRTKTNDSHSSDNSTTSELVDLSSLSVTDIVSASNDPIFHMEDISGAINNSHNISNNSNSQNDSAEEIEKDSEARKMVERLSNKQKNWRKNLSIGPEFHPFSDTDISPPPSPSNSRSGTPVKSDTEYECMKQKNELSEKAEDSRDSKWSWTWGELPTPPSNPPRSNTSSRQGHVDSSKTEEETNMQNVQRSMLGNMLSFMKATKKARHNPESEGIYLDDLNLDKLDPEVAALYFPRNSKLFLKPAYTEFQSVAKDEDVESGNGTSLPHSPHSVDGAIGGSKINPIDSDFEESSRHSIFDYKGYHDLAFSLCGGLHEYVEGDFPESLFLQSLVTYDDFCENPNVIDNPHLVVRLGGKYMNWATSAAQIVALALFQRPLPSKVIENLAKENMPKKEVRKRSESKGYSWFSWGRTSEAQASQKSEKELGSTPRYDSQSPSKVDFVSSTSQTSEVVIDLSPVETQQLKEPNSISIPNSVTLTNETRHETYVATVTTTTTISSRPLGEQNNKSDTKIVDMNESSESEHEEKSTKKRYRKTIRLSSEQIKKLNLKNGSNEVVFSVTTAYQGTTRCKCHIFLWNYDEKIVISDIDGTITKSDVLGHILPIIGKDWAQGGVAQLFTKIKNNGYNFLYLSARAIGQARITRDYLRSIKQGDVSLPDGPLLLNPTSLISAFHREVIEKKPEEFKISCLKDIKALFPSNQNPFYAGYGNKVNDVWAYSAVGIPIQRIFTINHKGELKHELTQTFQSTYLGQVKQVDEYFPPIEKKMFPRDLLSYMYSDDEDDEDCEGIVDLDYDSEWEGFPTGIDAMNPSTL